MYICTYIYIYTHVCIYIYIERERDRDIYTFLFPGSLNPFPEGGGADGGWQGCVAGYDESLQVFRTMWGRLGAWEPCEEGMQAFVLSLFLFRRACKPMRSYTSEREAWAGVSKDVRDPWAANHGAQYCLGATGCNTLVMLISAFKETGRGLANYCGLSSFQR